MTWVVGLIVGGSPAHLNVFQDRPTNGEVETTMVGRAEFDQAIADKQAEAERLRRIGELEPWSADYVNWPVDPEPVRVAFPWLRAYRFVTQYEIPGAWLAACSRSHPSIRMAAIWVSEIDFCGRQYLHAGDLVLFGYTSIDHDRYEFGAYGEWPGWFRDAIRWCTSGLDQSLDEQRLTALAAEIQSGVLQWSDHRAPDMAAPDMAAPAQGAGESPSNDRVH